MFRRLVLPALVPIRRESGPVRLRKALGDLGAGFSKLGQLLALRFDLLPPAYCYELFNLLDAVPPFRYEQVEQVVRAELGASPEQLFASFERKPFASASIGQVHR